MVLGMKGIFGQGYIRCTTVHHSKCRTTFEKKNISRMLNVIKEMVGLGSNFK